MSYRVWPYWNRNKGFWQQPSPRRRDVFSFMKSGPVAFHYDCACVLGTGGSQAAFITRKATCWDLRQNGLIETIRTTQTGNVYLRTTTDLDSFVITSHPCEREAPFIFYRQPRNCRETFIKWRSPCGRKASFPQRLTLPTNHKASWAASMPPALIDQGWTAIGA